MGIGDWGLGQSPIPNPQSPIPNNILNNIILNQIFNTLLYMCLILLN
ncbi:MAG: hypothetical protein MJ252_14050 [archaeon]|nr:hypothetical protein [archaeon]